MIHTQYANRIEVTHPDGPHRDQTVQLPDTISLAKRRVNRLRSTFPAKVAKGFTIRVVLADTVAETITPDTDRAADEQRWIDAEKAEWEASRPDYMAMADARIAAGKEPW